MTERQRRIISEHLKALSYSEGEGMLGVQKRAIAEDCGCLLIGFGGTGLDALEKANELLKRSLEPQDYEQNIAILAIDSADDAFKKTVVNAEGDLEDVPRFDATKESCLLPYATANHLLQYPTPAMKEWLNPDLHHVVRFTGQGANSIRQGGRVLLTQSEAINLLRSKVQSRVGDIMRGKPATYRLNVFLFFGIAGGTGSGTIIDGSYLVREFVYEVMPALRADSKSKFCGYIFLPPAGATVLPNHHRNGYAALKEVDHFMTLEKRNEVFTQTYDGLTITSKKNIFDICILLDGRTNGIFTADPRAAAFETAASSLLDAISTIPAMVGAGGAVQSIDEYMDNTAAVTLDRVKEEGYLKAARDANYTYAILGSAQALIPIDLMKSYVMHQVFQRMKRQFDNCSKVDEQKAMSFLKACSAYGSTDFDGAKRRLTQELRNRMRDSNQGPSYIVNLLNESAHIEETYTPGFFELHKEEKTNVARRLANWLRACNHEVYEVYTTVIEGLAEQLQKAAGILTDATQRQSLNHSTFSWMLIDFDPQADERNKFVREYLDNLVSKSKVDELIQAFQNELAENLQAWTGLSSRDGRPIAFCPEKRIRAFIKENLDSIVTGMVEDYLVKLYTGNPDARATDANGAVVDGSPEDDALTQAANQLVSDMFSGMVKAKPKTQFRDIPAFMPIDHYSQKIMMYVPECAPHLYSKIQGALATNALAGKVTLFKSYSSDTISCYWRYDGLPAYQISWVLEGEKAYENAILGGSTGLHMSEGTGSAQWRNFPNLCNRSKWNDIELHYQQNRESYLAKSAEKAIDDAYALGMATEHLITGTAINACFLKLPTENYSVKESYLNTMDNQCLNPKTFATAQADAIKQAYQLAQELYKKLELDNSSTITLPTEVGGNSELIDLVQNALGCPNTELEIGGLLDARVPAPTDGTPPDWTKSLAAKLLRMRVHLLYRVRGAVMVMQELCKLIEQHNAEVEKAASTSQDLEEFWLLCANRQIYFDVVEDTDEDGETDDFYRWMYVDSDGFEHILTELDSMKALEVTAKHFYAFNAYHNLDPETKSSLSEVLRRSRRDFRQIVTQRIPELQSAMQTVLQKKTPSGWDAPANVKVGSNEYFTYVPMAMASASFEKKVKNAKEIRDFYKSCNSF